MKKTSFQKLALSIVLLASPFISIFSQDLPNDMSEYRDKVGSTYLFYVTGDDGGPCFGGEDNVYTDESPLAVAAIHAGLLKANETKLIKVKVLAGRDSYPSVTRNGITSEEHEACDGSYQLSAPAPGDVAGAPTTMSDYIGKYDILFIFKVTGRTEDPIWGGRNNIYTTDSQIATAAVHSGVLKAGQTGIVKIKVMPGQNTYPEITRYGITSHEFGEWEGSYQFVKEDDKK